MNSFIIITAESEKELQINQKYLILTRYVTFIDGKQSEKATYDIAAARYRGDGIWDKVEIPETSSVDCAEETVTDRLVSCTRNALVEDWPGTIGKDGHGESKLGIDVVAYYPYPELPEMNDLPPMKI